MRVELHRLRDVLAYNANTGDFHWNVKLRAGAPPAGTKAGSINSEGYRYIKIDGRQYSAHKLAWLYVYGEWPSKELDHKNRVKDDNRIENLREATISQQRANRFLSSNTSGRKGVSWNRHAKKWRADIMKAGKRYMLGYFDDPDEAALAYRTAAVRLFGEFAPGE